MSHDCGHDHCGCGHSGPSWEGGNGSDYSSGTSRSHTPEPIFSDSLGVTILKYIGTLVVFSFAVGLGLEIINVIFGTSIGK